MQDLSILTATLVRVTVRMSCTEKRAACGDLTASRLPPVAACGCRAERGVCRRRPRGRAGGAGLVARGQPAAEHASPVPHRQPAGRAARHQVPPSRQLAAPRPGDDVNTHPLARPRLWRRDVQ